MKSPEPRPGGWGPDGEVGEGLMFGNIEVQGVSIGWGWAFRVGGQHWWMVFARLACTVSHVADARHGLATAVLCTTWPPLGTEYDRYIRM